MSGCRYCDAGFPLDGRDHVGSQRLGMIPPAPCAERGAAVLAMKAEAREFLTSLRAYYPSNCGARLGGHEVMTLLAFVDEMESEKRDLVRALEDVAAALVDDATPAARLAHTRAQAALS